MKNAVVYLIVQVFLTNDDLTEEFSPDSTEYFARVLQSTDSTTDLSEKKSL